MSSQSSLEELFDRLHWFAIEKLKTMPHDSTAVVLQFVSSEDFLKLNHLNEVVDKFKRFFPGMLDDITDFRNACTLLDYIWEEENIKLNVVIRDENYRAFYYWGPLKHGEKEFTIGLMLRKEPD